MSEKRSNIDKVVSEELIRQYLAGELDDKAMHQLEKQALDDPFLAEALEGYAEHVPDQRSALSELEGRLMQRVQQPVQEDNRKVRGLYYRWAAAAVILVLMGISTLWLFRQPESRTPGIAMKTSPEVDKAVNATSNDSTPQAESVPSAPLAAVPEKDLLAKDEVKRPVTPKLKQPPVLAQRQAATYAAPVPAEVATMDMSKMSADRVDSTGMGTMAKTNPLPEVNVIGYKAMAKSSNVSGAVTVVRESDIRTANTVSDKLVGKVNPGKERLLQGIVRDEDSRPLPGVTVVMSGSKKATVTDTAGRFVLPVDRKKEEVALTFNSVGFTNERRVVAAEENDITVAMKQDNAALNEVIVTGRSRSKDSEEEEQPAYSSPRPEKGFKAFREYLSAHTHTPAVAGNNKQRVKVGVSFIVQPTGELSDFKIYRSAEKVFEEEAIRVIKEGPDWLPASDKKATRVKVMVRFNGD